MTVKTKIKLPTEEGVFNKRPGNLVLNISYTTAQASTILTKKRCESSFFKRSGFLNSSRREMPRSRSSKDEFQLGEIPVGRWPNRDKKIENINTEK